MTKQEVFNKVRDHLLKQGRRSLDACGLSCEYLSPNGDRCAVGCLLTAGQCHQCDHLRAAMPGGGEHYSLANKTLTDALLSQGINEEAWAMLKDLQALHDRVYPHKWRDRLDEIAIQYEVEP